MHTPLDNGDRMDAIKVDFSNLFDLDPHGRLLVKIANSAVDTRVVVWIWEFLKGRTQRVRVRGKLSDQIRVTSRVPKSSVLGPFLFLAYVNDGRNIEYNIRLFDDDCVISRKILTTEDMIKLQRNVDRQGEWVVEKVVQIKPSKSKAVCFTRAIVKVCKGKFHSITGHEGPRRGVEEQFCSFSTSTLGRLGVQHQVSAALPRKRPATHCTGGWVGPRAGLDVCEKYRSHQDSIPDRPNRNQLLY
jgi:hypothetical protein